MWPEVNNRFNYPLKSALIEMEQEATLNMDDDIDRFCASSLLLRLAPIGLSRVVQAWNFHSVPGKRQFEAIYVSVSINDFQRSDTEINDFQLLNNSLSNNNNIRHLSSKYDKKNHAPLYICVVHVTVPIGYCKTDYTGSMLSNINR